MNDGSAERQFRLPCQHLVGVPGNASFLALQVSVREHLERCDGPTRGRAGGPEAAGPSGGQDAGWPTGLRPVTE
jgi:hypothetical protein